MNSILRPVHQACRVKLKPGVPHVSESSPSNQSDVVIVRYDLCSFNNRWRLENDVIDYNAIRFWSNAQEFATIRLNWSSVKRLKIYGLARHQATELLTKLNSLTSVAQLEIDRLELYMGVTSRYTFDSLDLLSIDSVRVIDINGGEKPDAFAMLEINAKELNTVYLGEWNFELDIIRWMPFNGYYSMQFGGYHSMLANRWTPFRYHSTDTIQFTPSGYQF